MTVETREVIVVDQPQQGAWAVPVSEIKARVVAVRQLMANVLEEGADYDKIPGVDKPSLTQVGAQTLMQLLNARPDFEKLEFIQDFEKPLFSYVLKCNLISLRTGEVISSGVGGCNSYESKYRWRKAERECPVCHQNTIRQSKSDKGAGAFYCWSRLGGCGANFHHDDRRITDQKLGRVENEDVADQANTILKIAKKRSLVDATLNATGANRLFTQDLDEEHIRQQVTPPVQPDTRPLDTGMESQGPATSASTPSQTITPAPDDNRSSSQTVTGSMGRSEMTATPAATPSLDDLWAYDEWLVGLAENHGLKDFGRADKRTGGTPEGHIKYLQGKLDAQKKGSYLTYEEWLAERNSLRPESNEVTQ